MPYTSDKRCRPTEYTPRTLVQDWICASAARVWINRPRPRCSDVIFIETMNEEQKSSSARGCRSPNNKCAAVIVFQLNIFIMIGLPEIGSYVWSGSFNKTTVARVSSTCICLLTCGGCGCIVRLRTPYCIDHVINKRFIWCDKGANLMSAVIHRNVNWRGTFRS